MTTAVDEQAIGFEGGNPNDLQAEQAVLGGMLLSPEAVAGAIDILKPDDFYRGIHATIFKTVIDLYIQGKPCDPVAVAAALAGSGDLPRVGGGPYLHTLIEQVPSVASTAYYARIIARHAEARRITEAGLRIAQIGRTPSIENKAARAAQALSDACIDRSQQESVRIGDTLRETLLDIEKGETQGPSTGFADLDRLLHGLPTGLIVIAGRPGMGKSTLAVDIARALTIRQQLHTVMFAIEMGRKQLLRRIISAESGVPHNTLKTGGDAVSESDWQRITRALPRVESAPLVINESSAPTIHDISAKARMAASKGELACLCVDHIGLCGGVLGSRSSRNDEVSIVTRGLKVLSKDLNIPVIAVSQLNRGPEQRADKRPQLADLRESGSVEQDADVVILVHRDEYYDKESPRAGEADFIVAKHRDGDMDTITVAAQLHLARFFDMAVK